MEKTIEIPEGYEARIEGNKVILEPKESEDERIRNEIIEFIDWAESRGSVRNDWHQKKRPAEWIAYLEKQKEQKPAEWSEEDKIHLMNAICAAEKKWGIDSCTANWLKSLRPSWKPSEEQMAALKNARHMMGQSGDYYDTTAIIDSLITDLQKLL